MPQRTMECSLKADSRIRVGLLIAYDGRSFSGWQIQPEDRTVQGVIEEALTSLSGDKVRITGAGRTDAGVSAWGQVAHFELDESISIPVDRLALVLNKRLPPEIRILVSRPVFREFHARYSARQKIYKYSFRWTPEGLSRHPGDHPFSSPISSSFVLERAVAASHLLLGRHDFRHFTVASSAPEDATRTIDDFFWEKTPDGLSFWISGPGFLHRMVRMIGGFLRDIGSGKRHKAELSRLLEPGSPPPEPSISPLPPEGLSLVRVMYRDPDPFDPRKQT